LTMQKLSFVSPSCSSRISCWVGKILLIFYLLVRRKGTTTHKYQMRWPSLIEKWFSWYSDCWNTRLVRYSNGLFQLEPGILIPDIWKLDTFVQLSKGSLAYTI
jgi:hypothetical protein